MESSETPVKSSDVKPDEELVAEPKKPTRAPTREREDANVVDLFSADELKDMSERCLKDYQDDVNSRSDRMKKLSEVTEHYSGLLRAKNFPWTGAANVNLALLTYPVLQIHARLYDMVWPENGKVMYAQAPDLADSERARVAQTFGNSYIRQKMPEMGPGLDDTLYQVVLYGSAFRRTYWDGAEERVRSDWIPADDFVVPANRRSQDPSMRDVPRYTMVQWLNINDIEDYTEDNTFSPKQVKGLRQSDSDEHQEADDVKRIADKVDGVESQSREEDPDAPRIVIEMHRRWRLPKKSGAKSHYAFDGKTHPVAITIDCKSKRVLRVIVREEEDPDDAQRFAQEMSRYEEYLAQFTAYQDALLQPAVSIDPVTGAPTLGAPTPIPPTPVDAPRPVRRREVCFFTHYKAFPSEGFYGLGFGHFLHGLAKAGNTIINQMINRMTLVNATPGFMSRQLKTQRGNVAVQPGEFIEVDGPVSAMKDGIMFLEPPPGDPATMPTVQMIITLAEKIAGTGDIASGTTSGANRTAKEVSILNAQMMKQISVLARRVKEAFRSELEKIWRCWGVFLPDEPQDMPVQGEAGQPLTLPISRRLFRPDARVLPAADPRMRFEKVEETQQLYGAVMSNPMTAQNPAVVRAATEELLRSLEGERFIALLGAAQPPPPPPRHYMQENADFMRGQDAPVHPEDIDDEHIQGHMAQLQSPTGAMMDPKAAKALEQHVRNHVAAKMDKEFQATQQPQQAGPTMGAPPPSGPPQPGSMGPPMGGMPQ